MAHPADDYITERRIHHDPQDVLDYGFRYIDWLADGETITDQTITVTGPDEALSDQVPTGPAQADGIVTVWLSGGTAGANYRVTCHIETSDSRERDDTLTVLCRNR